MLSEKTEKVLYNSSHKIEKDNFDPKDSTINWYLTRFIRQSMSPTGNILIKQDQNSAMCSVLFNGKIIFNFDIDGLFSPELASPFFGKNKIISIDNYNINLYYTQLIINNYNLFNEMIGKNNDYTKFYNIVNNEFSFFEDIVQGANGYLNLDFPFIITFKENQIMLHSDNEIFKISHDSEHIKFTYTYEKNEINSINFNKFIKKVNIFLYEKNVNSKIKISSNKFTKEHTKLLQFIEY